MAVDARNRVWHEWFRSPARADCVLALALAIPSLLQVLVFLPIGARAVGALVAVGATAPVAWRRSHPVAAALAGTVVWGIPTHGFVLLGYVAAFFLFYSLAAYVEQLRAVVGVVALAVAISILAAASQGLGVGEYVGGVIAVVAPAGVGRLVRRERAQARRLQELSWRLERERERSAQAAVAEERARIARELHDVVAHGVGAIAIQSDAADAALERDPELARGPVQAIRSSAREALAEMRRMVGMLRPSDEERELAPLPGLADLPVLLRRARDMGLDISFEQTGTPSRLAPGLDLSAYRIIQEALTNVRKHAGGAAAMVRIEWRDTTLRLEVTNCGAPAGGSPNRSGGHGIVGMRERVRLHGGELRAGPSPDGGFSVVATLPLEDGA